MEINTYKVHELTADQKRRCRYLSYRSDGDLQFWLSEEPNADVVIVSEGDTVLGWAMRTPRGETGYYVRQSHRRQGIGSKMFYILNNRRRSSAIVKPHDSDSAAFFYSVGQIKQREALRYVWDTKSLRRKPRREVMNEGSKITARA